MRGFNYNLFIGNGPVAAPIVVSPVSALSSSSVTSSGSSDVGSTGNDTTESPNKTVIVATTGAAAMATSTPAGASGFTIESEFVPRYNTRSVSKRQGYSVNFYFIVFSIFSNMQLSSLFRETDSRCSESLDTLPIPPNGASAGVGATNHS